MAPIRILELRSVRGTGGGPEKTILLGAARSDPARFAITVCYIRDSRDTAFEIHTRAKAAGVDYVEVIERYSLDRSIWPALRKIVRERRIDIIHAHEYKTDLLAWLLAKSDGIVPLATVHGWSGDSWKEQRIYYPLDMKFLRLFPRVVAVSGAVRARITAAGVNPDRVDVVLNGIDEQVFRRDPAREAVARQRFGLRPEHTVVGGIGRLESLKRFDLLIEAVNAVRAEHPHLRLLIAGEGSARGDLQAQIDRFGLGDVCRLVGLRSDVVEFHHALDMFVQSSATEASPNVILEALAMETPIVATDVGGTTELMRPGVEGIAVTVDAPAIAAGIRQVLADRTAARRRAVSGRRRVEQELSFSARMARLDRIYEDLAAARPGRRRA
jgi:glycosyltransferase involved in cell wall biosynthesis